MTANILVIEDEPGIANTLCYALKTENFEAHWCKLVSEAETALLAKSFDLIILDVGLPDKSGFDFLREFRKKSSIPVIFLTARSEEIDRVVGLEMGADDYVIKPFSPREVTARIRAILRRNYKTDPTPANNLPPSFLVDDQRCIIFFESKPLKLSRYEYKILKVLINRPGIVYSRDQLMEQAWDDPLSSLDRTIDAHIKNIRAELKRIQPNANPIKTHRGFGYSLGTEK